MLPDDVSQIARFLHGQDPANTATLCLWPANTAGRQGSELHCFTLVQHSMVRIITLGLYYTDYYSIIQFYTAHLLFSMHSTDIHWLQSFLVRRSLSGVHLTYLFDISLLCISNSTVSHCRPPNHRVTVQKTTRAWQTRRKANDKSLYQLSANELVDLFYFNQNP